MSYLTDTEKRLLFSALRREKEVCQRVDDTKVEDATSRLLVPIVESLERKFYYDRFEKEIRKQAIEEFAEKLHELCGWEEDNYQYPYLLHKSRIDEIAKQIQGA